MVPEFNAHAFPTLKLRMVEVDGFGTLIDSGDLGECLSRFGGLENMAVGIGFPHFLISERRLGCEGCCSTPCTFTVGSLCLAGKPSSLRRAATWKSSRAGLGQNGVTGCYRVAICDNL